MSHDDQEVKAPKSLLDHIRTVQSRRDRKRPASFYLLCAIVVVLLLGAQIVYVKDDPKHFALFLTLYFIFFFVVIFRAILDGFDIVRSHFRENEQLLSRTFVDDGFAERLGAQVAEKDGHSGRA